MRAKGVVRGLALGLGTLGAAVLATDSLIRAADHGDSPQVRLDGRMDINDVYVFQSPQTPANTVLIATVSPLAGITGNTHFTPKAQYVFNVDNVAEDDSDVDEDQTYTITFGKLEADGTQKMKVQGKGADKFVAQGVTGTTLDLPNGGKIHAGLFDDPFFFDLIAFKNDLSFSAENARNFFKGLNTMAIVLEVPSAKFETQNINVWFVTRQGKKQTDRMGRPAINTVLIPGPKKNAFNSGHPSDDNATYRADAIAVITALGNGANAAALADALLPDVLSFDTASAAGFLNGRRLEDDVIDAELQLLTNNEAASDFVANDSTFRTEFPYLGTPNK
jgi:hypothetical protein